MKGIGPFRQRDFQGQDRPRAIFSKLPISIHDTDFVEFFDDFSQASVNDATNQWIVVKDASASALIGTGDLANGVMTLTSAATTDNDGASIQRAETHFLVKSGLKLMFEARVKVSDADQGEMFIGLADNFATDPEAVIASGLARIGFELVDGAATINTVIDDDTSSTRTVLSSSMSDDTYVKLGFMTDGASIRFYVNRSLVSTQSIPSAIAAVTLGPAFFHLSGDANGTHTASVDYIQVVSERA